MRPIQIAAIVTSALAAAAMGTVAFKYQDDNRLAALLALLSAVHFSWDAVRISLDRR